ncbi:High-copy suppressor of rspA [Leclercia adecarboxylata]|uniref:High-copy suppressor of rspA n=1 Tax=Leclercia adecarboxylata TaxID=83655 RepID=A0A4U9HZ27_9ENTR|nr:High-copy suppressor of rspA [Leclercia adecarboxylata]
MYGGSLFRASISAVPFLLPLLFQVGFGMDAFHSGLLVLAVFVGNLTIKPATTPLLRGLGFKKLLLINGALNVLALLACAFLTPQTPVWVIMLVLYLGGVFRSIQFTAISTLAFADVPSPQMSYANTLFSTATQLAWGWGSPLVLSGSVLANCASEMLGWKRYRDQLPAGLCGDCAGLSAGDVRYPAAGERCRQRGIQQAGIKKASVSWLFLALAT